MDITRSHEFADSMRNFIPKHMYKKVSIVQQNRAFNVIEILEFLTVAGMLVVVAIAEASDGSLRYVVSRPEEFRVI